MIFVELSGGLGNQFFRYACARKVLQDRGGDETLFINTRFFDHKDVVGNVSSFNIYEKTVFTHCRRLVLKYGNVFQKVLYLFYSFLHKYNLGMKKIPHFYEKCGIYIINNPNEIDIKKMKGICSKKIFIIGNTENPICFEGLRDILLQEFIPKFPPSDNNCSLYKVIKSSTSVCIAIRRGDFINEANKNIFHVCNLDYYQKAIKEMIRLTKFPTFIVFSNDLEWVMKNLNFYGMPVFYESGKDPVYETFRLMYSCKHFIISNSTFHWWAQYCSRNSNKIVISPDRWFANSDWNMDLLHSFIKISTR